MNQALNQTLSRTHHHLRHGLPGHACRCIIFGGGAINDFAFTFLVGIITGTYSSIYIASALVLWWHKGAAPAIERRRRWRRRRRGGRRAGSRLTRSPCSAPVEITGWHWAGFIACVLIFLALDLGVFHRRAHTVKFKEALVWSVVWFSLAMLFAPALSPCAASRRPSSSSPAILSSCRSRWTTSLSSP